MIETVIVYLAKPFVYRLMASIQSAYEIGIGHVLQPQGIGLPVGKIGRCLNAVLNIVVKG